MKNIIFKYIPIISLMLLFAAGLLSISFTPVKETDNCLQPIRDFYANINNASKIGNNNTHIAFSVKTIARATEKVNQPVTTSEVDMYYNNDQSWYLSNEISVFEDQTNSFTVVPGRKEIYWGNSARNFEKDKRERKLFVLQDTLFKLCTVKECKAIEPAAADGCDKLIVIASNEKLKKIYDVSSISFWYNSATKQVKKIVVAYPDNIPIISMEANFKIMNYNYQGKKMSASVKKLFIKGDNHLTEKYKEYKLIDNRVKK